MDNLYWLHELRPSDLKMVGERAFLLGNLTRQRHPVIPGFVISAAPFWQFLRSIDWSDPLFVDLPESLLYFDINNFRQLQTIAQRIRSQMLDTPLPPEWVAALGDAVGQFRTPACLLSPELLLPRPKTSGILETASCWSDPESVALGVKRVWAQVFRARSLLYWRIGGLSLPKLKPIVLVQPLHDAIASGSVRRSEPDTLQVRANWGLATAQTAGETEPERYWLDGENGEIRRQTRGRQSLIYRLKSDPDEEAGDHFPPVPCHPPIRGDIIEEARQDRWILAEPHRSAWVELMREAIADIVSSCGLDWIARWNADASKPQFLISGICSWGEDPPLSPEPEAEGATSPAGRDRGGSLWGLGAAKGRAVAPAHVMADSGADPAAFEPGSILVVPSVTPRWLPLLKLAAGLIAERGGMTGHGAIIARELGIPAVLGVPDATRLTRTGQVLIVDGDRGEVRPAPEDTGVSPAARNRPSPAIAPAPFPTATRLMANVSQFDSISRLPELPIDGVGLVRSELLALDVFSTEAEAFDADGRPNFRYWLEPDCQDRFVRGMREPLGQLAAILAPRPIFYRALDLREFERQIRLSSPGEVPEWVRLQSPEQLNGGRDRGDRTLFDLELAVLSDLQGAGVGNLNLILPFVRSVREFSAYRGCVERAGLTENPHFQLWMMAEVPSVIFQLADYEKAGARGIAIGTNDLTQLMLGIDRDRVSPDGDLNACNPAMMKALQQLIETAEALGLGTSICGDAPTLYPDLIDSLIRWGIQSISVSPDAVGPTQFAIARAEQRLILAASRRWGRGE